MRATNVPSNGNIKFFPNGYLDLLTLFHLIFFYSQDILTYLEKVAQRYIANICQRKKLSHEEYSQAGGKVLTYGSYHLGVHSQGIKLVSLPNYTCIKHIK